MPVWALGSFLPADGKFQSLRFRVFVSMPVWALGSFLRRLFQTPPQVQSLSQCPCGLWGLFYSPLLPKFLRPSSLLGHKPSKNVILSLLCAIFTSFSTIISRCEHRDKLQNRGDARIHLVFPPCIWDLPSLDPHLLPFLDPALRASLEAGLPPSMLARAYSRSVFTPRSLPPRSTPRRQRSARLF